MKKSYYLIISIVILSSLNTLKAREIRFLGVSGDLLLNVERNVRLVKRLREKKGAPLLEGEQKRLESRVESEIQQALEPFGYYNASVESDNSKKKELYRYIITLNTPVRVGALSLELNELANKQPELKDWQQTFPLKIGLPLNQAVYINQKKELLSIAVRLGYFDAKYTRSEIIIDEPRTSAAVSLSFQSGQRYVLSDINIDWNLDSVTDPKSRLGIDQGILNSLISIKKGQFYKAEDLSKTQTKLLATPYFSAVDVRAGERNQQTAQIPIEITLTPRKRKAYNFAVGAGSDTGIRASIGYENRRINRKGHNINVRAGGSEIRRTAISNYRIPLQRSSSDSLNFFASLKEEFSANRRFKATQVGSEWALEWNDALLKLGISASRERFTRLENDLSEIEIDSDLLMPSLSWEKTQGDDLYFPTNGWSASAIIRGASASLGSDVDLVQAIFSGKLLRPLGSGRLKFRLEVAGSLIDDNDDLPESLGFLAGGDNSLRGYDFETIGVDLNGGITVAENLAIGSVEYEHPIKNGFSVAAFVDVGDAFNDRADLNRGAGLGLRWRLPFGAMRLDAASALDLEGAPIRLHFSFGTDL